MSEAGDYTPRIWKGHDFGSARAAYDSHVGRSYADAVAKNQTMVELLPEFIETLSEAPLILISDETGSMREWPKTMFSKMPYLFNEAHDNYLGPLVQLSFGAFGDAHCFERFSVQARPFAGKDEVKERILELQMEGGGGGQIKESSELVALYYCRNCRMPNAQRPPYIFITDEYCWSPVDPAMAAAAKVKIDKELTAKEIFEELQRKFEVYLIQKPYLDETSEHGLTTKEVRKLWLQHFDEGHIATLADPNRVVDVIFGILAAYSGKIDYFKKELEDRQLKDADGHEKIDTVYKALNTIHAISAPAAAQKLLKSGHSRTFSTAKGGKKSKDLA